MPRTPFCVYIDEAGDRGWGGRASSVFVLSAVMLPESHSDRLRETLDEINEALKKPRRTVLHWSTNIKTHSARKFVSTRIAQNEVTLTNVVVLKHALMGSGTQLSDPTVQYNYPLRRILERVSWFVDDHGGEATITFAHVKNFPYGRLEAYLDLLQRQATQIRWDAIKAWRIDQPRRVRLLQVADVVAGSVFSALRPDDFGAYEPTYLLALAPRIYVRGRGKVTSYGMNVVGPVAALKSYPWWSAFQAACLGNR